MSLVKTEKWAVAHLTVRLYNQLIAVAGTVNRERQAIVQSSQLFLKLVLIATSLFGHVSKSLHDSFCRRSAVILHVLAIKLANQSFALHQVEAELRNSELAEE